MTDRGHAAAAARRWAETWQRAWEALDADAVVALYAPDAVVTTQPFRESERGIDAIRGYIAGAFAEETAVRAWVGTPMVDGDRASVEWWAALTEAGEDVSLAGTSTLRFDANGLVTEQRDSWNLAPSRREPPAGWGR